MTLIKRIALVIFSTIFTFLILELTFRSFDPVRFQSFIEHSTETWELPFEGCFSESYFLPSRTLGYEMAPNSKRLGSNSLGMKDKERTKDKSAGIYRIICLGDSTTANSDYVNILEELLNEKEAEREFEVWNCGVMGYNATQYCRALEEKWLKYNPDMVIVGFCLNDFDTTPLVIREGNQLIGYFPYREILQKVNPFLLRHSALYRFIIMKLFFQRANNYNDAAEQVRLSLQETKRLLAAKDVRFLIVILGIVERMEDSRWRENYKETKKIIKDYHIESLDIVPLFEKNEPEALMWLNQKDKIHFNKKGSQIIAEAIRFYLKQDPKEEK